LSASETYRNSNLGLAIENKNIPGVTTTVKRRKMCHKRRGFGIGEG